jgi:DNA-binding FadR family transcriptional regulator
VEKELAAALGVSRGSLREGVRALAIMGILETRQGDGTYVTRLDPTLLIAPLATVVELQSPATGVDLQSVRRILEMEAAFRAASRITPEELAEAERILLEVAPLTTSPKSPSDRERFLEADLAFHSIIASASRNGVLESLISALAGRTARARLWRAIAEEGVLARTNEEHHAILAALQRRDSDGARMLMATHLHGVETFLREHGE